MVNLFSVSAGLLMILQTTLKLWDYRWVCLFQAINRKHNFCYATYEQGNYILIHVT
jgi:hypothetical protein